MSSYSYCKGCGCGMDEPELNEVIAKRQDCPRCRKSHDLSDFTCEQAAKSFMERFERMEKFLEQWMPKE